MNQHLIFSIIGYCLLFSLISFLVEMIMKIKGYIRGNTGWLIIASFFLAIFKQVDFKNPTYIYILFSAFAIPLIINRYDLSMTIKGGKWWWKLKDSKKSD